MALIRRVCERPSVDHATFDMIDGRAICSRCHISLPWRDCVMTVHECPIHVHSAADFHVSSPRVDE